MSSNFPRYRVLMAKLVQNFLVFSFGRLLECRGGKVQQCKRNCHISLYFTCFISQTNAHIHTFRTRKRATQSFSSPCSFPTVIWTCRVYDCVFSIDKSKSQIAIFCINIYMFICVCSVDVLLIYLWINMPVEMTCLECHIWYESVTFLLTFWIGKQTASEYFFCFPLQTVIVLHRSLFDNWSDVSGCSSGTQAVLWPCALSVQQHVFTVGVVGKMLDECVVGVKLMHICLQFVSVGKESILPFKSGM